MSGSAVSDRAKDLIHITAALHGLCGP